MEESGLRRDEVVAKIPYSVAFSAEAPPPAPDQLRGKLFSENSFNYSAAVAVGST
jgi:hypothetical protein